MSYLILTRNWLYIIGSVLLFVLFSSEMAQAARSAAERGVGVFVASDIPQYRASWAVVIGINRYTKAPRLNYAVNDAKSVVAAVQKREAERNETGGEASKASQAKVIAQLQPPASVSRPPVVLPTVAEMPKYKVGDSWTVRFAEGQTSPRIVRAIEKDQYVFEWGLDLARYYDQNLVLIKQVTREDGKEVRTSLLKRRTMGFPLAANKTWKFRYKLGGGAGGVPSGTGEWREFNFKVLGSETRPEEICESGCASPISRFWKSAKLSRSSARSLTG
jgi:hypothetical protein